MRTPATDFQVHTCADEMRSLCRHDLTDAEPPHATRYVRKQPLAGSRADAAASISWATWFGGSAGEAVLHGRTHLAWTDMEFKARTEYEAARKRNTFRRDMTIQDWGITYAELEPYYRQVRVHPPRSRARAGNLKGELLCGGNPLKRPASENTRCRRYRHPRDREFTEAARKQGATTPYAPRNASRAVQQPDGSRFGDLPVLRLLPALRLRGEREGQPDIHVIRSRCASPARAANPIWSTKV